MTLHVVYNGGSGGLGRHLRAALVGAGVANTHLGSRLGDAGGLLDELDHLPIERGSSLVLIQSAGMVSVGECEEHPDLAHEVNVTRTADSVRDFLEWSVDHDMAPGVVFVGSSHVYGMTEIGERLTEASPTDPRSVYAKTKLEGEAQMRALADVYGPSLAIARVFGMIGPDQRPHFLLPGLIRRVHEHDLSDIPGLDYVRDYLDARDICRHLASLAGTVADHHSVTVNVCSGEPTTIGDLLDRVLQLHYSNDAEALEKARETVSAAPGRDTDVTWSVGDPTLLSERVPGPIRSIAIADTVAEAVAAD